MSHSEKQQSRGARQPLDVICEACGAGEVTAHRTKERILIRCEACGVKIFAYYLDPHRKRALSRTEADLLKQVTPPAAGLYRFLRRFIDEHGYAPTLREMREAVGWSSVSTVRHHLQSLEAVGLIEREYGAARGIRLLYG